MDWIANRPETTDAIPNFRAVRPSPTNPHRRPFYIDPAKLKRNDSTSSSEITSVKNEEPISMNKKEVVLRTNIEEKKDEDPTKIDHFEMEPKKEAVDKTKFPRLVKWAVGLTILVASAVAAIMFVNYYTHPFTYDCTRSQKDLGFNDVLVMNCILDEEAESLNISFNPECGSYKPQGPWYFVINDTHLWQQGWNISRHGNLVNITKPQIKCNSGGHYTFVFVTVGKKTFSHTEFVTIENKLSDVSLEVEQNNDTSNGYYQISCSARSGCTPAPISLLGVFTGGKTEPIFGVNFTCIINYNDDSGWTASCTGTVPEDVYSTLSSIACRPTTGDKNVDDEKEIKYTICRDCIFECPKDETTDSYWYDHQIFNIFHRCSGGVLYTQPCPTTTYFNTETCACDFTSNLPGKCDSNNKRVELLTKRNSCEYVQN